MRRIVRVLATAALFGTLSGCDLLEPDPEQTQLTLYVAPSAVDCVGVGPQQCLLVREQPGDDWSYFYETITGFTYEPGYTYTLLVERRRVDNPPADGSSFQYSLLRILAKEAAPSV